MSTYPGTLDTFSAPVGTTLVATDDHALQHRKAGSAIINLETVLGTTGVSGLLVNFAATDKPVRVNASLVVQQAVSGTIHTMGQGTHAGTMGGGVYGTALHQGGTAANMVLGTPTVTVGSDATGDMYYRNGGTFTRLPIGTNGQVITTNGTTPSWGAGGVMTDAGTYVKPSTDGDNLRAYAGNGTSYIEIANNGTNAVISSSTGHVNFIPATNKLVNTSVLRQDGTTNSYVNNVSILTGWGSIPIVSGQQQGTTLVTFGGTFSTYPIVVPQVIGFTTSTPSALTDFTTSIKDVGLTQGFGGHKVGTTSFAVSLWTSGAAGANVWYGFTWVAYGVLV